MLRSSQLKINQLSSQLLIGELRVPLTQFKTKDNAVHAGHFHQLPPLKEIIKSRQANSSNFLSNNLLTVIRNHLDAMVVLRSGRLIMLKPMVSNWKVITHMLLRINNAPLIHQKEKCLLKVTIKLPKEAVLLSTMQLFKVLLMFPLMLLIHISICTTAVFLIAQLAEHGWITLSLPLDTVLKVIYHISSLETLGAQAGEKMATSEWQKQMMAPMVSAVSIWTTISQICDDVMSDSHI
jgi:hypothetical protein